jgi:IS5 family transposase
MVMAMNTQQTLGDIEYAAKKRRTRKEIFLEKMEGLVPWREIIELIEPVYPKTTKRGGRPPVGVEKMLRMLLVQSWFNLSDEATEDAVTEIQSIRRFVGVNLMSENAPDATTLLKFRHLLEQKGLFAGIFSTVNQLLVKNGLCISKGTIVDATIISAPTSTKNASHERDPEMHSTKKGNQWYFGMKAHAGVDEESGVAHSLTATAANAHDITEAHNLIRDDDERVRGDAGYLGMEKREEIMEKHKEGREYIANLRPGKVRGLPEDDPVRAAEKAKSSIRSKVERVFWFVKQQFGYRATRYRGLSKNLARLQLLLASANLLIALERGVTRPST